MADSDYPTDLLCNVRPLIFAVDSIISNPDASEADNARGTSDHFDRFLEALVGEDDAAVDGTTDDAIPPDGLQQPPPFPPPPPPAGAKGSSGSSTTTSSRLRSSANSAKASSRSIKARLSKKLHLPSMTSPSKGSTSASPPPLHVTVPAANDNTAEAFLHRANLLPVSARHAFPPSRDPDGVTTQQLIKNSYNGVHAPDGILPTGWLEKHLHALPSVLLVVSTIDAGQREGVGTTTTSSRGSTMTTSDNGSNTTSGRTPSTESARSRKRRREREQVEMPAAAAPAPSSSEPSSLAGSSRTSLPSSSAGRSSGSVDTGVSTKKSGGRKRKTVDQNGGGGRDDGGVIVIDDGPGPAKARARTSCGSITTKSNSNTKNQSTTSSDPETKERKEKNKKSRMMQQSTLFGKIVDDIRKKDASTLPTTSRTYENKSEGGDENDVNQSVTSFAIGSSSADDERAPSEKGTSSRGEGTPTSYGSSSNAFVEGRFRSLKATSERIMKETFGIATLRNLQPLAVDGTLRGQSQIIVMQTGGGKSLCYQLPAAVLPGVTIVVSPLIALMVDQVQALNARGIPAALYSSASGQRENTEVLQRLVGRSKKASGSGGDGRKKSTYTKEQTQLKPLKCLYCTPELVETDRFRAVLSDLHKRKELALFAVDEAHCLSTWGHDFRPAYRKLSWIRQAFPDVPLTACTATATPKVISDIRTCLDLPEKTVPCHLGSFNRENISYEVRYKDNIDSSNPRGSLGDLIRFVRQEHEATKASGAPCSGIVYVHKRADTSMIAHRITRESGVSAAPYHAGLKNAERSNIQKQWTDGTIKVAVATVAFGMGIDLAHVRYVLHWSLPKTVEGFYQESGRAGRDGLPSKSILYYSKDDASKFAFLLKKSRETKVAKNGRQAEGGEDHSLAALQKMVSYCTTAGCRRRYLLCHFGEKIDPKNICKKTCDYCKNPSKTERAIQTSEVSRDVASMVQLSKGKRGGSSFGREQKWDGQWSRPHGDSDDEIDSDVDDWDDAGGQSLGVNGSGDVLGLPPPSSSARSLGGFVKASTILDKYEQMEVAGTKKSGGGGFINFRARDSSAKAIPEHLRRGAPDPLQSFYKPKAAKKASEGSKALKSQIEKMEQELAREEAELEARKAKLLGKKK
mmetsp:Transcript_20249/g.44215  ORF Transcript_20249/g.44215 Transcript_20249/m.44215 type:complete len:1139 (+) Transcript_20249:36-3452(+)